MIVVVAVYERDNLPHVFGPFKSEDEANAWIDTEKQGTGEGWDYSVTEIINPKETNG